MKRLLLAVCWATLIFTNNAQTTTSQPITSTCLYVINQDDTSQLDKICFAPSGLVNMTTTSTNAIASSVKSSVASSTDLDYLWILLNTFIIFVMQIGWALLEAGTTNAKSSTILFKNIMNIAFAAIGYYLFGHDVGYGINESNDFIGLGKDYLALAHHIDWNFFYYDFLICLTTVGAVGGAIVGRCSNIGCFAYTILISTWLYPTIAHWIWSNEGWMSSFNPTSTITGGIIDYAGSGVVFMTAGLVGFWGAVVLGPRPGVFEQKPSYDQVEDNNNIKPTQKYPKEHHKEIPNASLQILGLLFVWAGWYGFNLSGTLAATNQMSTANKIAVTTTISAVSGGIASAIISKLHHGDVLVTETINGVLAGLVSITAACATVDIGDSIAIGVIGVFVYHAACEFLVSLKIDDPLKVFPVYGCCGMWGLIAVSWFSSHGNIAAAGFSDYLVEATRGKLFSGQILAAFVIFVWASFWAFAVFIVFKQLEILEPTEVENQKQQQQHSSIEDIPNQTIIVDDESTKNKTEPNKNDENDPLVPQSENPNAPRDDH